MGKAIALPLTGGVHGGLGRALADGADVSVHPGGVAEGVGGVSPVLILLVGLAVHLGEVVEGVAVVVHALFPGVLDEDGGGGFLEVPLVLPAVGAVEAVGGSFAGLGGGAASAPGVGRGGGGVSEGLAVTDVGVVHDAPEMVVLVEERVVGLVGVEAIGGPGDGVEPGEVVVPDVVGEILLDAEGDLLEVGGAGDGARLVAGLGECGEEHGGDDGDDGDDDEELDEREAPAAAEWVDGVFHDGSFLA